MPTLAEVLGVETPASPKVRTLAEILNPSEAGATVLAFGVTRRVPVGYETEAEYLASQRPNTPLRTHRVDRHSHRRWQGWVGTVGEILETKDRRWGTGVARRQRARQAAAQAWYGCPNIILGQ